MAVTSPSEVTIRTYDVGFGDCFLLSFRYPKRQRHILIDFGSMSLPKGKNSSGYMERIAQQIATDCGGKLDAVVATHRHRDHINGFTLTGKGAAAKGPGAIIRGLKPSLVVQPWTEDPQAATDTDAPTAASGAGGSNLTALYLNTLERMHEAAAGAAAAAASLRGASFEAIRTQLALVGTDNLKNPEAIENLRTMAPNRYVYCGGRCGLESVLPGVKIRVLGPPTLKQTRSILKQRAKDPDEFWHLNASFWNRQALTAQRNTKGAPALFPHYVRARVPWAARWYRYYAMKERADSLLSFVRILDDAMNNTSVILLFQVKNTRLLFPGDAQYENWMYALGQPGVLSELSKVDVYKVGHHGSLNATPKTLWNGFKNRGPTAQVKRLATFLSTKEGTYGNQDTNTEVPRRTLLTALRAESALTDTEDCAGSELVRMRTISLT